MALRYALHVASLGELDFRSVLFQFADGHEERVEQILVTGDPFEHDDRWWRPAHWHAERDENDIVMTWLVCSEAPELER